MHLPGTFLIGFPQDLKHMESKVALCIKYPTASPWSCTEAQGEHLFFFVSTTTIIQWSCLHSSRSTGPQASHRMLGAIVPRQQRRVPRPMGFRRKSKCVRVRSLSSLATSNSERGWNLPGLVAFPPPQTSLSPAQLIGGESIVVSYHLMPTTINKLNLISTMTSYAVLLSLSPPGTCSELWPAEASTSLQNAARSNWQS